MKDLLHCPSCVVLVWWYGGKVRKVPSVTLKSAESVKVNELTETEMLLYNDKVKE